MKIYQSALVYYQCDECGKCWKTEEDDCHTTNLVYRNEEITCPYCGYDNKVSNVYLIAKGVGYREFLETYHETELQPSATLPPLSDLQK